MKGEGRLVGVPASRVATPGFADQRIGIFLMPGAVTLFACIDAFATIGLGYGLFGDVPSGWTFLGAAS